MKFKKALQNPFVLMAQGFVAGAFMFSMSLPAEAVAPEAAQTVKAAELAESFEA